MTPYIGMPIAVFGGLDNGQFEHAGVVTFVHRRFQTTLEGQLGIVNVRAFLDGSATDRVLKTIPLMESRGRAVDVHTYGITHAAFIPSPPDMIAAPEKKDDDGLPPMPAMVSLPAYLTEMAVQ